MSPSNDPYLHSNHVKTRNQTAHHRSANAQPLWPDRNMDQISVKKLDEMLHAVACPVAGVPAVLVQYGRNTPALQLSKAANDRADTVARACIHQQHGLNFGIDKSVKDVESLMGAR